MLRRGPVLMLAVAASIATSRSGIDYRAPCTRNSTLVEDWDPNRPFYLEWWRDLRIPTDANFRSSVIVRPVGGEPIDYFAVSVDGGVVHVCPKGGLLPDTEYEWVVRQFLNSDPNHLPVPLYEQTGITRLRTASTSALEPITSERACRRFAEWDFRTLPACTSGWLDFDGDGWGAEEDCDDQDPNVNPGTLDVCDGIDNDCDGQIDPDVSIRVWPDADGDGFGDGSAPIDLFGCDMPRPDGAVANGVDCDDTNAGISPIADDVPGNGIDEDCDGSDAVPPDTGDTNRATATGDTGTGDTGATGDTAADTGYRSDTEDTG
ncbi:MAG: putative metal-binding motif-containing protein [Myxococcota bacterium]